MTPPPQRVAVIGLGPVGRRVAALVHAAPDLTLAGLVDTVSPADASDFGLPVLDDPEKLDAIDVAVVCTSPFFDRIAPTLRQCLRLKAHVVSPADEMAWPWLRHPHLADVMAQEARAAGVTLLGIGGDGGTAVAWPALLTAAGVADVREVRVVRTVNAADRPADVRRAAGLGVELVQFRQLARADRVGRLGVGEGVTLIAQGLGRHPMRAEVTQNTDGRTTDGASTVTATRVTGTWTGGGLAVNVDLTVGDGLTTATRVEVVGEDGRTHVQTAEPGPDLAALLLHAVRCVGRLPKGLATALDLPLTARVPAA